MKFGFTYILQIRINVFVNKLKIYIQIQTNQNVRDAMRHATKILLTDTY